MAKKDKIEVDYVALGYESFEVGHLTLRIIQIMKIYMVACVIYGLAELYNYSVLQDLYANGYRGNVADIPSNVNDLFQGLILLFWFIIYIAAVFHFLKWTIRANKAVRALGASGFRHSTGWAAGCYFIPIVSLWIPFQAMSDLYKASVNPLNWKDIKLPSIFNWWWGLWIFASILSQIIFKYMMRHDDIESIIKVTPMSALSDFLEVPLAFMVIKIVEMVYSAQQRSLHGEK